MIHLDRQRSRVRLAGLAVVAVLLALATAGGLSRVRVQTGIESFLPSSDASLTQLNTLARAFGGEPVVVLLESEKPKQLLDQDNLFKLLALEGKLSSLPDVAAVYGPATVLNQIAGQTQNLLAELTGRRDALEAQAVAEAKQRGASEAEARAAGKRAVRGFDQRYGALIVQGLPAGLPTLRNASFVDSVIFSGQPKPRAQWRFVVPNGSAVAVLVRPRQGLDAAAAERLVKAVRKTVSDAKLPAKRTTVSGAPTLVAALSNQVSHEMPVLAAVGLTAVAAAFLLLPWTRRSRRLLPLATTLTAIAGTLAIYGWAGRTLSLGIVAFLPVLMGIGSFYPTYFARRASARVVGVIALGTAASFATLALSPLPFVRDLGLTLALGVVLSCLIGWAVSTLRPPAAEEEQTPKVLARAAAPSANRHKLFLVACAVGALFAVVGWSVLPGMRLQTDFVKYSAGLDALGNAQHVQKVLGTSGEMDIVLTGPDVTTPAAYKWMRQAQNTAIAQYGDRMRPVVSVPTLLDFLGSNPTAEQIDAGMRFVPEYLMSATVIPDHSTAILSFGVDIADLGAVQDVIDGLREKLAAAPAGYEYEIAGLPVVAARGAKLISDDRYLTNVLGIAAATVVLLIGLRRRADALRAGTTALMATGIGLFLLWAADVALSPITAALGALTAAVAAEFTVMLSEANRARAALQVSVLLAVATSALGYLSLTASQLAAIREFGILLAGAVIVAFLCALAVVRLTCRPEPEPPTEVPTDPEHQPQLAGAPS